MPRNLNWGPDAEGADLQTQEDSGDFIVAQTLDSNGDPVDVLLEWDDTEEEWVYGGPINLGGANIENLGDITADGTVIDVSGIVAADSPEETDHLTTKEYVDSVAQGLDWQESIIERRNDPPSDPADGDRYLVDESPTGDWDGEADSIAEWDDDNDEWDFTDPDEGFATFDEDTNLLRVYDGSWKDFGSAIDHGNLQGLSDDDHDQYLLVDGTRAMSGALDLDDNELENTGAVSETETVTSNAGSSYEADLADGGVHKITLTEDCDITLAGSDSGAANSLTLVVAQDGSGGHSVTWPSDVLWPNGNDPSVSDGADEIDRFAFTHIDGDWYGSEAGTTFEEA